jgi:soluble lytic murein transglycosylase
MKKWIPLIFILLAAAGCKSPLAFRTAPTATATATSAPTFTPTPTPLPSPTPTPTPVPAVVVQSAEALLVTGDYESARREFQSVQTTTTDVELQAAAAYGVGKALFYQQNYSLAASTLEQMVANYPQSAHLANAYFYLARCYEEQDAYEKAANAYGRYLELKPGVIDAEVQERRGDALVNAGDPGAAIQAYSAAIQAPQLGTTIWTELKLGKAYAATGDFSNAIKKYLEIYDKSDNDYARAQANLLMAQSYLTMGMPDQANTRLLDSISSFPRAYDTYSGLVQLVNAGVPVNELQRGMVDYYAGQYGLAIEAFSRYIDSSTDLSATAYHYRALSHLALDEAQQAIADWDIVIQQFPGDSLWTNAYEEKAYALWGYMDDYDGAAGLLLEYVEKAPDSSRAPDFLFQAARIQERGGKLAEAAATWERLIDTYPSAEQSYRGLFLAGISYYRVPDYPKALTVFQRLLVLGTTPDEQAAAYFWIGKTQQAQGDSAAAQDAWSKAAQQDPTGYYSERANELLAGRAPFSLSQPVDLGYNLEQERLQAEAWLRTTFAIPPETDLNGLGDMASDPRVTRASAFWELGLYSQARNELESLRQENLSDVVKTYRLMNYMLNLGLYRPAVLSSRQILDLAHLDDVGTLQAPAYFNHIRFGIYFKDQILAAGQAENMSPLLLLSVMRQESMFEGFAESSAGARGLMQIMPVTGQEIAGSINWPVNFTADDLDRPDVSITLGARYLARQRDFFNGDLIAMLAAYNGGPGNTMIWQKLAGDDPDLLLEVIRADETRKYITQIYEFFNIYRLLYSRGS